MFNLNRLSDQQLDQILQRAKAGDNQVLQSLGLYSPIPLLSEKMRRNSMRQAQAAQSAPAQQPTVADKIAGVGSLPVPGVMREENFAEGGIVAFAGGGSAGNYDYTNPYVPPDVLRAVHGAESSFGRNMVSPAGATGHFQFMPGTAKEFGLDREGTYDFEKSKTAAAKYLARLYNEFGNWEEALRAYNAGPTGYRRIKEGKAKSPENEAYFGRVKGFMQPGRTPLENTGVLRAGVPTGVPLGDEDRFAASAAGQGGASAQRPQSDSYATTVEAINKDRNARLAQIRKDAEDEIKALGPSPQPGDLEAIRAKALAEAQAINEPYLREMDALLASGKPDTERMGKENFNNSLLKASLALMTGRGKGIGGALADLGAAGGIGVDQYAAGKRNIDFAEQKHREAQLLGNKSKLELAKGDKKYADELADAQVRQDRIAANAHKAGIAQIQQSRRLSEQSLDQASDAQLRGVMGVETARIKEAGQERRDNEGRTRADNLAKQQEFKAMMDKYRMLSSAVTKAVAEAESTYLPLNKPGAPTREQVIEEARRRVLLSMDSSPEEYSELSRLLREKAGIKTLSSPAPAAAPVKTYTMDQSGKFR